jgi:hypothetical protein
LFGFGEFMNVRPIRRWRSGLVRNTNVPAHGGRWAPLISEPFSSSIRPPLIATRDTLIADVIGRMPAAHKNFLFHSCAANRIGPRSQGPPPPTWLPSNGGSSTSIN